MGIQSSENEIPLYPFVAFFAPIIFRFSNCPLEPMAYIQMDPVAFYYRANRAHALPPFCWKNVGRWLNGRLYSNSSFVHSFAIEQAW